MWFLGYCIQNIVEFFILQRAKPISKNFKTFLLFRCFSLYNDTRFLAMWTFISVDNTESVKKWSKFKSWVKNHMRFRVLRITYPTLSFINPGESLSTSANQNLWSEYFEIWYPNGSTTQCYCWYYLFSTAKIASRPTLSSATIWVPNFKKLWSKMADITSSRVIIKLSDRPSKNKIL